MATRSHFKPKSLSWIAGLLVPSVVRGWPAVCSVLIRVSALMGTGCSGRIKFMQRPVRCSFGAVRVRY